MKKLLKKLLILQDEITHLNEKGQPYANKTRELIRERKRVYREIATQFSDLREVSQDLAEQATELARGVSNHKTHAQLIARSTVVMGRVIVANHIIARINEANES